MLNKIKKNNSGFTIIEVLIVLAIAGLILLVVFLAVPALQRNQRNQGYRSEANRVLGSVQEISANNGGNVVGISACGPIAPATVVCSAAAAGTASLVDAQKVYQASNAKNIDTLAIKAGPASSVTVTPTTAPGTGTSPAPADITLKASLIVTGAKCSGQASYTSGTTRQTVLMYAVEDSQGAVVTQCQES